MFILAQKRCSGHVVDKIEKIMKTIFDTTIAEQYKSASQKIRVLTEAWVDDEVFCPACGTNISNYENNRPVADFYCPNCGEEYELKSKKEAMGKKIVDGAYSTMIQRLQSRNNPNFFFLNYNPVKFEIQNFIVIPKHFFTPEIIEKRKPLSPTARRAGWTGCNILLEGIPQSGKIFYIKNGIEKNKKTNNTILFLNIRNNLSFFVKFKKELIVLKNQNKILKNKKNLINRFLLSFRILDFFI